MLINFNGLNLVFGYRSMGFEPFKVGPKNKRLFCSLHLRTPPPLTYNLTSNETNVQQS